MRCEESIFPSLEMEEERVREGLGRLKETTQCMALRQLLQQQQQQQRRQQCGTRRCRNFHDRRMQFMCAAKLRQHSLATDCEYSQHLCNQSK